MTVMMHAGLHSYMGRNSMSAKAPLIDGSIVLVLDKRYRVFCRPAPHGDLVFESRLVQLPTKTEEADELIRLCLMGSWVRLRTHSEIPVLSNDQTEISLQQRIPADASVDEFEGVLEQFTNAIAEWRRIFRVL
jgi:hypothetical protein